MQAIKAIYDGVGFTPRQPIPIQGHYEVVITFIKPIERDLTETICKNEKQTRMDWLNQLKKTLELSRDEDLSNFPTQGLMKESYDDWLD